MIHPTACCHELEDDEADEDDSEDDEGDENDDEGIENGPVNLICGSLTRSTSSTSAINRGGIFAKMSSCASLAPRND